ncbi:Gfo/Idh/MocA family oxidoreductase [Pseudogracilibacillus sp. SE30717A]|uniref:Gfo/Idh/MocA family protein n=1 Tax=Pseudogracilibacillus sp. SE30717A TaxID=3098293 RepID=UPI00300E425F
MSKVKWGVLSTAQIAQTELIPAFHRSNNAQVYAIASLSGKAEKVAKQFGIPKAYNSYEKLLEDPQIEAVYIPLPNHLHKEWVIKAAQYGKHILCEKPAALNVSDMEEMKKACEENNVLIMEAFMYFFHPQHDRVKEIIKSGEIGDVKLVKSSFSFLLTDKEENIRMNHIKGGGVLYDLGCYGIHSIRNILENEPTSVHVHAKADDKYMVETDTITLLEFPNGVTGLIDSSFSTALRNEYEVVGTKGRIIVPRAYRPDLYDGEGLVLVKTNEETREESIVEDQYKAQVEHISQAIRKGNIIISSPKNSLQNVRVIEACLQSIKNNGKVLL